MRASELANAFGSTVIVLGVATAEPVATGGAGAFGLMPYLYEHPAELGLPPRVDEALWGEHREHVRTLFAADGIPVEFVDAMGQPADELVALAEQRAADMIVVGTREPGFVERLLGGDVSGDVARRARCDVLIVHPRDEDRE